MIALRFLLLAACALTFAPSLRAQVTTIDNVTIVDVTNGRLHSRQSIVIEGRRITRIERASAVTRARATLDGTGMFVIHAQAYGTGTEQELLLPVVAALAPHATGTTLITADAGYHSEANLRALAAQGRPALIADNGMRARDERFATQTRHQQGPDPLHDTSRVPARLALYHPSDFTYDPETRTCVCPAGKSLHRKGKD